MKIVDRMPHVTAWPYEENFARQLPKEPYALRICSSWRPNASSLLLLSGRPSKDQGPRRRLSEGKVIRVRSCRSTLHDIIFRTDEFTFPSVVSRIVRPLSRFLYSYARGRRFFHTLLASSRKIKETLGRGLPDMIFIIKRNPFPFPSSSGIRLAVSSFQLASHEDDGVRKEKERLTAAQFFCGCSGCPSRVGALKMKTNKVSAKCEDRIPHDQVANLSSRIPFLACGQTVK